MPTAVCAALLLLAADPALLKTEFIYDTAPFPSCHASTIVETPRSLVAAWFGGSDEGNKDVGIWLSRQEEGTWTTPTEVANGIDGDKRYPCWNPVLFQTSHGPLWLFYKVGPSPSKWWGMLKTSTNGGLTWSDSQRLPDGILGPIKNKPIELDSGDILCPTSSEHAGWRVHFERTSDRGVTWSATEPINDGKAIGAIQPSILRHKDGKLLAIGRTRGQGQLFETWSDDEGKTWSPLQLGTLPNPNAGADAVTLADGRFLLVYNHTKKGRSPLNVAVSEDGKTWNAALVLESEPGEYSYPAVIQTRDKQVHITYTWKRKKIKHVALDPTQLKLRPIKDGQWPE